MLDFIHIICKKDFFVNTYFFVKYIDLRDTLSIMMIVAC